jgi:hypothetical protein
MSQASEGFQANPDATGVSLAYVTVGSFKYPLVMPVDPRGHYKHDVYTAAAVAMAKTASKHYLSIYNADVNLKVEIAYVKITQEETAAVTGLLRGYRLFRFTTNHSGGSTPTVRVLDTTMTSLSGTITCRSNGPTVAGIETEPLGVGVMGEEDSGPYPSDVLFDENWANQPIVLNQNQGVTIQQDATAGTGTLSAAIVFRVR